MKRSYSFIIPVFNRPEEIRELLESFLVMQFSQPYEIVIVEDGSTISSEAIAQSFRDRLPVSYYFKENTGPGDSRNYGMENAKGNYFIILDSDCLVPAHYLETVDYFLEHQYFDCYGGADAAHQNFSDLQKAINYVMTSFYTTGGIRGAKKRINTFEPRSFNMGISKAAFEDTGGFAKIHPGEDPDLSQRILKAGYQTTFIPDAFVYHKRRISWDKFYTQVKKFGLVRPILNKWHPKAAKFTYWLPTLFVVFTLCSLFLGIFVSVFMLLPLVAYVFLIFIDSSFKNKNIRIGLWSVFAMFIQFSGYGLAFLKSTFFIHWLNKEPEKQFPNLFFK